MGRIVERETASLIATDGIRYRSLADIFGFYFAGRHEDLAPPAVRPDGKILDGNNRSVAAHVFGRASIKVYEAQDREDLMTAELFPHAPDGVLADMNANILYWYDCSSGTALEKLVTGYEWLKDEKTAAKFLKEWMDSNCHIAQPYPW